MNREEAIQVIEISRPTCGNTILCEALDMAISALRQQECVGEANKTLTLDELRKMDGEPVWVCFSGSIIYEDGWFIITETEKCEALLKGKVSVYKDFECYGKTWMAYRQKPEEDKHEAD